VHKALASNARQVADDLVKLTCIVEFIGRVNLEFAPVDVVMEWAGDTRALRNHDLVPAPEPSRAVLTRETKLSQWVAVRDPRLLRGLATLRALVG
jgi:hypothetical protein